MGKVSILPVICLALILLCDLSYAKEGKRKKRTTTVASNVSLAQTPGPAVAARALLATIGTTKKVATTAVNKQATPSKPKPKQQIVPGLVNASFSLDDGVDPDAYDALTAEINCQMIDCFYYAIVRINAIQERLDTADVKCLAPGLSVPYTGTLSALRGNTTELYAAYWSCRLKYHEKDLERDVTTLLTARMGHGTYLRSQLCHCKAWFHGKLRDPEWF